MKRTVPVGLILICSLIWVATLPACAASSPIETTQMVETVAPATTEDAAGSKSSAAEMPLVVINWSTDMACTDCHIRYMDAEENLLFATHTSHGVVCSDCHLADSFTALHSHQTTEKDSENVTMAVCLTCHESYPTLADLTVASTVFQDIDGNAINPHATHRGEVECSECHSIHTSSDSMAYCADCHHAGLQSCSACHED